MKKIIAFISALALCAASFSCSGKNKNKKSISDEKEISDLSGMTAVKLSDTTYKKSLLDVPSDMNMIYCAKPFNGGSNYLLVGSGKKTPAFWTSNRDLTEFKEINYPDFDIGTSYNIAVLNDGTMVTFVNSVDYGDLPEPDPYAEDYDAEVYEAAAEYSFRIYTYSPDGRLLTDSEVTDFHEQPNGSTMINEIASDGKFVIVSINGSYEIFTIDGAYNGELTVEDNESVENIGADHDGNIICAIRTGIESVEFRKIAEDGSIEKSNRTYTFPETVAYEIVPGSDGYSMFVSSMTTIYGIKSDDNTIESLFSLNAAGLNSSNFSGFAIGSDGSFIIPVTSYSEWSVSVKKFTTCDPSELENIPTITVGIFHEDQYLSSVIGDFNENSSDCRVKLEYYQENIQVPQDMDFNDNEAMEAFGKKVDDAHDAAVDKFRQDITNGELPDVLILDGGNSPTGVFGGIDLASMGGLCDLYEFMDKDDTLTRDSFVPSLLNAVDENFSGHIYSTPTSFSITLPNTAKTKFVKDIKKWDFNTFMDYIENQNDILGRESLDSNKTQRDRAFIVSYWHWIDKKKAKCSFDSPEFLRYLKYCLAGEPDPEPDENYVYEEPSEEEIQQHYIDQQCRYIEDKALLNNGYISRYVNYLYEIIGTFGNEDVTVLGEVDGKMDTAVFSFDDKQFAIPESSQNKELAWEFIKYQLSDRMAEKNYNRGSGFPVTKSGLAIYRKKDQEPESHDYLEEFKDYTGCLYYTGYKDENGNEKYIKIGNLTDEIADEVDRYIAGAVLPDDNDNIADEDYEKYNDIYDIFHEELDRMFHYEITPEECADMIQNRMSIYLSENFG